MCISHASLLSLSQNQISLQDLYQCMDKKKEFDLEERRV